MLWALKKHFFIYPFAGKIDVSIPWTSLYSMPVVLNVEDVYVLAAPLNDGGYDPGRDAALQNAIKRKKLADLEQPQAGDSGELIPQWVSPIAQKTFVWFYKNRLFVHKLTKS